MEKRFALVNKPSVFIFDKDLENREDELLHGWAVRILGEYDKHCHVVTHYGYEGYIDIGALTPISRSFITNRGINDDLMVISNSFADILSLPKVQGSIKLTLPRGAYVVKLGEPNDGYQYVKTADGKHHGFVRSCSLRSRLDNDEFLLNINYDFNSQASLNRDENSLREQICANALEYLGVPYCWGGKTPKGIDCSGLMFMSYMLAGILIFRNSQNNSLYPVKSIQRELLKKADLIYWHGHVGMDLGNDLFIHSTGNSIDFKCVISSFLPSDQNYRSDLAESIIGYGSIF